jgi:hypothetical protein
MSREGIVIVGGVLNIGCLKRTRSIDLMTLIVGVHVLFVRVFDVRRW